MVIRRKFAGIFGGFVAYCTSAFLVCASAGAQERGSDLIEEDMPLTEQEPQFDTETFTAKLGEHGGEVDFVFGDDRPFKECHASTVVQAGDGSFVAAWFAGTEEKDPDVGIWHSRFVDGAWLKPTLLVKVNETAHWNPVLFRDREDMLYIFFKVGPEIPYWETYWMKSADHGENWTPAAQLVPGDQGGRGPVKNKPIVLSDGTWLAGASTELDGWKPFADRSTDRGTTWTRSDDFEMDKSKIPGIGAIQPTVWESSAGTVHALMRTAMGQAIRSDSRDGGKTWSECYVTAVPNNNSGLDAVKLEDGRILLALNPVDENWGPRTPLSLAISEDNGKTWDLVVHLETEEGEYSYPALVHTADGVAVCYTWKRERVRCWRIPQAVLDMVE